MKRIVIGLSKEKPKKVKKFPLKSTSSKEVDGSFIIHSTLINLIGKFDDRLNSRFYKDKNGIIYLPVLYIELLREYIIQIYQKTKDPIFTGYKNKGDLHFTMEFVRSMYNESKSNRIRLVKKAAFIFYNIASKHPFTDGNKRSAIIACNSFLEYNGHSIGSLPYRKSYNFIKEVAKGTYSEKDCQKFIGNHISKLVVSRDFKENIKRLQKEIKSKLKKPNRLMNQSTSYFYGHT